MDDDTRIRIAEHSLELGKSTIPSRADDFTAWIERTLSTREDVGTVEVTVRFSEEETLGDALTFLEGVDAAPELRTDVSEVTLVLRDDGD